jgi:hypothetical protein
MASPGLGSAIPHCTASAQAGCQVRSRRSHWPARGPWEPQGRPGFRLPAGLAASELEVPSSGQLVKNEIKRSFRSAANIAVNDPAVRSRVVAHLLVAMDKSAATTPAEKPSAVVTAALARKQHPRKKTARTLSTGRHTQGTSGPSVYRAPHLRPS